MPNMQISACFCYKISFRCFKGYGVRMFSRKKVIGYAHIFIVKGPLEGGGPQTSPLLQIVLLTYLCLVLLICMYNVCVLHVQ